MDFFEHQDRARKLTRRLVALFVLAVVLILLAVNLVAFGVLHLASTYDTYRRDMAPVVRQDRVYPGRFNRIEPLWTNGEVYVGVSIVTLLIIFGGSAYKTASLSSGGPAVAQMMGGKLLVPQLADDAERTLQNVVEEMAIAAGLPVPAVYVMEEEHGINAFAAGFTPQDAAIGVTRGAVDQLSRDELQGVIAHEFSHILNGDMRLNVRLIGILHGILVIGLIGYGLLRSLQWTSWGGGRSRSRDDKDSGAAFIILAAITAVALIAIGYIGLFFGRLIQAAVSRQREFLADASAVQFTRNPNGLAGALKKLGAMSSGSRIENMHAMEISHMFFANGMGMTFANLLATHPPLAERIRAIDPMFNGVFEPRPGKRDLVEQYAGQQRPAPRSVVDVFTGKVRQENVAGFGAAPATAAMPLAAGEVAARVGKPTPDTVNQAAEMIGSMPPAISAAAREPFGARGVVFCLLLDEQPDVLQKQLKMLENTVDPTCYQETLQLLKSARALGPAARMTLLDLALPALRQLSQPQTIQFRRVVKDLIEADGRVSLFEYALHKILGKKLWETAKPPSAKYVAIQPLLEPAAVVLSALATADGKSEADQQQAFVAGTARLDAANLRPPADASLQALDDALNMLAQASPPVKRRIIDACAHCVAADGIVQLEEAELLRAVAAVLDCPLPPLVNG